VGASSSTAPSAPRPPVYPAPAPGANSWTGLVQAWPIAWRAPGTGVLGPRPGTQHQQAYMAAPAPSYMVPPHHQAYMVPPQQTPYTYAPTSPGAPLFGGPGSSGASSSSHAQQQPWDMSAL
jgi:hypothetical protein